MNKEIDITDWYLNDAKFDTVKYKELEALFFELCADTNVPHHLAAATNILLVGLLNGADRAVGTVTSWNNSFRRLKKTR